MKKKYLQENEINNNSLPFGKDQNGREFKIALQVFCIKSFANKEEFRNSNNKIPDWAEKISSSAGFLKDQTLYLPDTIANAPDFQKSNLFILQDSILGNSQTIPYHFPKNSIKSYEYFHIKIKEEELWLRLNYDELSLGEPQRENFDICPLKVSEPRRILINGRTWHSLTGRRAATYHHFDYIFTYLGYFNEVKLLPLNRIKSDKIIPTKDISTVDLRKILY